MIQACGRCCYEALGYESDTDALADVGWAVLDDLVVRSGRELPSDATERQDWLDTLRDVCELEAGHDGPCLFRVGGTT